MPLYQLNIQKVSSGNYWTNRYYINAESFDGGLVVGRAIADIEKTFTGSHVQFVSQRVSTPVKDKPNLYVTEVLGFYGQKAFNYAMPLTVCVRVELRKGPTRPDVKYYRASARAEDLASSVLFTNAYVQALNDGPLAALLNLDGLVDRGNRPYDAIEAAVKVSQHQLRRGTKAKVRPVIPVT